MDGKLLLTYEAAVSHLRELNSSFDAGLLKVCYTGDNNNKSHISRETFEKCMGTIYNCPIVCNYDRETDELGGHDIMLVTGADGEKRIINATTPVGVVPESANPRFETMEDENGVEHEYLLADVVIWKRQEAYERIKNGGVVGESMEITVNSYKRNKKTDIRDIDDFEFTAMCLLGDNKTPCFEGASLELYSASNLKDKIDDMMHDLKDSYESVMTSFTKGVDDIHTPNTPENNKNTEGGENDLEDNIQTPAENAEVIEQVVETVATENGTNNESFELSSTLREWLDSAVRKIVEETRWGLDRAYWYVDHDADLSMVYVCSVNDCGKYFALKYTLNNDSVEVDVNSKTPVKMAFVPMAEGADAPQNGLVYALGNVIDGLNNDIAEKDSKIGELTATASEVEGLRKFKLDVEAESRNAAVSAVFEKFSCLDGNESFEALKNNYGDMSAEDIEEKCYAIKGKMSDVANVTFTLNETSIKTSVDTHEHESEYKPYGSLFDNIK